MGRLIHLREKSDRLWENPGNKGKSKKHFIHPKVKKYVQKCRKIAPNVIKITNSNIIPLFKLQNYLKITFFQVLKD
jgi:hypothetical protein